jgi:hypothetical protein
LAAKKPFSVWWSPTGKAHVGQRGGSAVCGSKLPIDAPEWGVEEDGEAAHSALCTRCKQKLRKPGPWTDMDGWVRPPAALQVYVGSPTESWRLNEVTWRRLIVLANGQRLTRESVVQVALAAREASGDPTRQHVAKALDSEVLLPWAEMVDNGWCPDAAKEPEDDYDTSMLLTAFLEPRIEVER